MRTRKPTGSLRRNTCKIIGSRHCSVDLSQGRLELPCQYTFRGDADLIKKLKKILEMQPCSRSGSKDGMSPEEKKKK